MLVVAEPRSGATKFCQDLAKKHDLKIPENELAAYHIKDLHFDGEHDIKMFHEAGQFGFLDWQTFYDMHENMDDYVVLMNACQNMFGFNKAEHFILRKSSSDSLISWVNYNLKLYHLSTGNEPRGLGTQHLAYLRKTNMIVVRTTYLIANYCLHNSITPIWYEDLEYAKPVNSNYIDNLMNDDEVYESINQLVDSAKIESIKKQLQEKQNVV